MCSGLQSGAGSFKQPDPKSIFDAKIHFLCNFNNIFKYIDGLIGGGA